MSTVLPGANSLGFGFNVYGEPSMASKTLPLFDMSEIAGDYSLGDKTYDLPGNALPDVVDEPSIFEQKAFESASEFVQELKTSAHANATIGAFEASATAKYDRLCQGKKNVVLFTLSDLRPYYTISLKSLNPDYLAEDAAGTLDALPDSYKDATKQQFFAFFRKYGMYFVKSVIMGGRLTYYSAVEKRENETTESLMIKVKASYEAMSGKGATTWNSVDKQLFASSRMSIETLPPGSLSSANPQFGDDLTSNDGYKDWVRAAKEEPGIIGFQLAPMADLFPFGSAKHDALLLAREDFGECYVYTEATLRAECPYPGRISVKGVPLIPDNMDELKQGDYVKGRVRQVIIDRHTFEVRLNKAYGLHRNWVTANQGNFQYASGDMLNDILPFNSPDYILIISSEWDAPSRHNFCVSNDVDRTGKGMTPTQQKYFEILRNAGAGRQLEKLLYNREGYTMSTTTAYVFIGVLGQKTTLSREVFGVYAGANTSNPVVNVSFEQLEKNGKPYYTPIL
jgi:hypothetical protein